MSSHFPRKNGQLQSSPLPTVSSVLNHAVRCQLIDHTQTGACRRPSRRRKPWNSHYTWSTVRPPNFATVCYLITSLQG